MSTVAMNELLPIIRSHFSRLKIPHTHDKVYKDECVYSFDSPFTDTGLYVNLTTFLGVGQRYLQIDAQKTNCRLYLHEKFQQVPATPVDNAENVEKEVTKLAIGVDGGFNPNGPKYETIKEHFLVVLSEANEVMAFIPLPNAELPEFVSNVINEIIKHEGMRMNLAVSTWEADNEKIVSKYAESLQQVNPSGKRIPQNPKLWKDEASDATENLWLNLSTGYIGGGRKNWDGSGGSGSALQHYIDTGRKYPLVVKLGTITPHGADVWSYAEDEDRLVIDPLLADHLSFWGIDVMKLEKTEKTISEMEVTLNLTYDWSKILDKDEKLEAVTGPGYIGLQNIGSSCYMNSLLQCLLSIPEFQERYYFRHQEIVQSAPNDPTTDLPTQLSKVCFALFSENYVPPSPEASNPPASLAHHSDVPTTTMNSSMTEESTPLLEKYLIAPRMFKYAMGRNHPEFSSGRQQDVSEYFTYFLDQLDRTERVHLPRLTYQGNQAPTTGSIFHFHLEVKYKETQGGSGVKLLRNGPQTIFNMLELPVPTQKAIVISPKDATIPEGKQEEKLDPETKRQKIEGTTTEESEMMIPFEACLESYFEPELVEIEHPAHHQKMVFSRSLRFQTFPRYLVIKLSRYYINEQWVQKKITAEIPMPLTLDLSEYKARGVIGDEYELQETTNNETSGNATNVSEYVIDEGILSQLTSMGFSENGCRRALFATHTTDVETAMNWIIEHMEDPDFNDPPVVSTAAATTGSGNNHPAVNEESVQMLTAMGYTVEQCTAALIATDNNIERAADWLFSHVEDLDAAVAEVYGRGTSTASGGGSTGTTGGSSPVLAESGAGKYTLKAIISHLGKNTDHGHYVCHILKDNVWTLFNDEKVAKCQKPPLNYGFMYIYRRDDGPGTFFL